VIYFILFKKSRDLHCIFLTEMLLKPSANLNSVLLCLLLLELWKTGEYLIGIFPQAEGSSVPCITKKLKLCKEMESIFLGYFRPVCEQISGNANIYVGNHR